MTTVDIMNRRIRIWLRNLMSPRKGPRHPRVRKRHKIIESARSPIKETLVKFCDYLRERARGARREVVGCSRPPSGRDFVVSRGTTNPYTGLSGTIAAATGRLRVGSGE